MGFEYLHTNTVSQSNSLERICEMLLERINSDRFTNSELIDVIRFLAVIDRMKEGSKSEIWKALSLPFHDVVVSEPYIPLIAQKKLFKQLLVDLAKKEKKIQLKTGKNHKYEVVSGYEGVRKGILPVDITIFKNDKIKGFIEVDGEEKYRKEKESKQQKLRRSEQLKEALYLNDYPGIPFIRVSEVAASQKEELLALSIDCLSAILNKRK
jgi:HD superfamily phosphohydrolase